MQQGRVRSSNAKQLIVLMKSILSHPIRHPIHYIAKELKELTHCQPIAVNEASGTKNKEVLCNVLYNDVFLVYIYIYIANLMSMAEWVQE